MLASKLNLICISISLEFLVLLTSIFGPDETNSCETRNLYIIPLHADGLIVGDNAVLVCLHSYEARPDTQCQHVWSRSTVEQTNQTRPTNEYVQGFFTSSDSSSINTDRHILIIPNVTKEDSLIYNCSIQSTEFTAQFDLRVYDPQVPEIQNKSNKSILNQPVTPVSVGERYSIDCDAIGYPIPTISWLKNSKPVTEYCHGFQTDVVEPCLSENSTTLTIKKVDKKSEGKYNCTARSKIGTDYASSWIITRNETSGTDYFRNPEILRDSSIMRTNTLTFEINDETNETSLELNLTCYIAGWPIPNVTWFRNKEVIPSSKWPELQVIDQNELIFKNVSPSFNDEYGCTDRLGKLQRTVRNLKISRASAKLKNDAESFMVIWIFIFFALIIGSAFTIMFFMKSKESDFMEELIQEFHKGRQENLNSDLEIKEKAECLPYNREYEFPRSNLKLGKRLGSGAFGLVMFGEANGIVRKGLVTPVAVKMVKNNYEISQIRALASELKIMQTIGKHLNIVNLLGACTDNLKNLLVITEFCSYGNLHEFLLQNRIIFVSQVDSETGFYIEKDIKSTILQEMMSVTYVESESEVFAKLRMSQLGNDFEEHSNILENNDYDDVASFTEDFSLEKAVDRKSVDISLDSKLLSDVKDMPKSETVSNHYEIDLNLSSKVKFDKTADISKICTDDLFCWAYQIARGMEYLSSRKIIHGDLAIRNVLLANHNIVKISDFGLSKNVYHYADENYVKKSKQALPVKWMALESIADRIFSSQSDVWTYGIVLWELFSLAETPYAGMDDFERLFHKLKLGFRMERPPNATTDIYNLMLECWNKEPKARPNFTNISGIISDMLEKTLRDYYIGLMEYIEENPNKIYDDYYQVMCYKNQSPLSREPLVDIVEEGKSTKTNTLELMEFQERATTPGYLDMHGNS